MFTTPLFYIMVGIAVVIPILVLVMTTTVGGSTSVDPVSGIETVVEMEPMTNTWQVVESISGACMILAYFIGAVIGGSIAGLSFDAGLQASAEL